MRALWMEEVMGMGRNELDDQDFIYYVVGSFCIAHEYQGRFLNRAK